MDQYPLGPLNRIVMMGSWAYHQHAEAAGALRSVERAFQLGNDSRCCGDRCINPYECLNHLLGIGARMEFCLGKREIYYVMILLRQ